MAVARAEDTVDAEDAVARFTRLMVEPEPRLDVAMLVIATGAEPGLDEDRWLAELDRLAVGVDSVNGLMRRLFVEEAFAGNVEEYYDPRNSLLHRVLSRRLGIPISLAIVCMEVGRRAGVPMEGIGMPGHFLLRPAGTTDVYYDPFTAGATLDIDGCRTLYRAVTGSAEGFDPELLAPSPVPSMLVRVLQNLRGAYRMRRRAGDLERVLRMRAALPGVTTADLVELGSAMGQQGRWRDGARLLDVAATTRPDDAELLARAARALRANLN